MKKRELFVFAGQSNMMGAGVYPPRQKIEVKNSFEYLHKGVRMGEEVGRFRIAGFPCGEYTYKNLSDAYPNGMSFDAKSSLSDHTNNAYFDVSMSNLKSEKDKSEIPFPEFSESNFTPAPAIPPYFAMFWEGMGHKSAYAHIAKGGVSILYYFNDEMLSEYRELIAKRVDNYIENPCVQNLYTDMCRGASAYFFEKSSMFFKDSQKRFISEDLSEKYLVWLQGESDTGFSTIEYKTLLEVFWKKCKELGFTKFLCIRVGYFGNDKIVNIMKAQEEFCKDTPDAFMMTRAYSLMPYVGQEQSEWFSEIPTDEYQYCRDSFYGFTNQHINEKGHLLLAKRLAENLHRMIYMNKEPLLESELVKGM